MILTDISKQKQKIRTKYRNERKTISSESKELLDFAVCSNVFELSAFKNADTVLLYYPVNSEPNVLLIAEEAYRLDKRVAFPVSHSDTCTLTFHFTDSISVLNKGTYGICEPSADLEVVSDFSNACCIVPGLVFDREGYRVGYGKGYYDRFLQYFGGVSIGLVYSSFLLDSLPHETTDCAVNILITERGIILP